MPEKLSIRPLTLKIVWPYTLFFILHPPVTGVPYNTLNIQLSCIRESGANSRGFLEAQRPVCAQRCALLRPRALQWAHVARRPQGHAGHGRHHGPERFHGHTHQLHRAEFEKKYAAFNRISCIYCKKGFMIKIGFQSQFSWCPQFILNYEKIHIFSARYTIYRALSYRGGSL